MQREPLELQIEGLDCPDCAASLEKAVQGLPQVASARLMFMTSKLSVVPTDNRHPIPEIQRVARSMGYQVTSTPSTPENDRGEGRRRVWARRQNLGTALGGVFLLLGLVLRLFGPSVRAADALYAASIIVGGMRVARAGWAALWRARSPDMNTLMAIAALGAMAVGEFAEGAVTIFLFSVGELLESYSADRARRAVRTLMESAPKEAALVEGDRERQVPVSALQIGDRILVRPGEKIPMDGSIFEGESSVNQAPITGESMLVEKAVGDEVFAGTVNAHGAIVVEVTRRAVDNTIARIMRLVEEAQSRKAPSQRFVDRFARYYTPAVIVLAALVGFAPPLFGLGSLREWGYRALVLLVIACPCALVISTPVTIVSALARAARSGVLIKGGKYLEELASLRVVAFDKTGTLTRGEPRIAGVACALDRESGEECLTCQDLLSKAAALEGRSEHPLAQAVIRYAREMGVQDRHGSVERVTAAAGLGIEGSVEGHTISIGNHAFSHRDDGNDGPLCAAVGEAEAAGYTVLVAEDVCCNKRCYFAASDALREGIGEVIEDLKRIGVEHTVMLTGDNAFTAHRVAEDAGIDEIRAGLLPEGKLSVIEELQARHQGVAMVGDGVNDAPAMAKATVGIAMGAAGTDAALETADVALMGDDLSRIPHVIRLSKKALRIVRGNIAFSMLIKAVFLALAIGGISTLWMAVAADMGASLVVTLNGLRMLGFRDRERATAATASS